MRLAFFATPARIPPGWFTIRAKVPVLVPSTTCKYYQISNDGTENIIKYQKMIQGILTNIKVREYKNFTPPPPRWHERTTSDWVALVAVSQSLPLLPISIRIYQNIKTYQRSTKNIRVEKYQSLPSLGRPVTVTQTTRSLSSRSRRPFVRDTCTAPHMIFVKYFTPKNVLTSRILPETPTQHHTWYLSDILHQKIFKHLEFCPRHLHSTRHDICQIFYTKKYSNI